MGYGRGFEEITWGCIWFRGGRGMADGDLPLQSHHGGAQTKAAQKPPTRLGGWSLGFRFSEGQCACVTKRYSFV